LKEKRSLVIGLVISALALAGAVWGVQPGRILDALEGAKYIYLLPMTLLLFVGLLTRARSWQILLNDRVPFWRTFGTLNEGYLLNMVFPLKLGEFARAYMVTRGTDLHIGWTTATVVLQRIIDIIVCLLGLLLVLPFIVEVDWASNLVLTVGVGLAVGLSFLFLMYRRQDLLQELLDKIPFLKRLRMTRLIEEFFIGLGGPGQVTRLFRGAFWSLLAWATNWLTYLICLDMFHMERSPVAALFVTGVIAFGAAIPSLPGAVGVFELSAVAGLLVFGYPQEAALSFAVVNHMHQLIVTGILGALALSREGETITGLEKRLRVMIKERKAAV
jgi:glycosyltransferase 2 family protein